MGPVNHFDTALPDALLSFGSCVYTDFPANLCNLQLPTASLSLSLSASTETLMCILAEL